jgi:hypothetical protein
MTEEKVMENRIRRIAERRGYKLEKSRRRDDRCADFGMYRLVDPYTNVVVFGAEFHAYDATLEQIEKFLDRPAR